MAALFSGCSKRQPTEMGHLTQNLDNNRKIWCLQSSGRLQILQPPAHVGSSLADFSSLKTEAIRSSETSVHTRCTQQHIPEDGILHRNSSFIVLVLVALISPAFFHIPFKYFMLSNDTSKLYLGSPATSNTRKYSVVGNLIWIVYYISDTSIKILWILTK
jgi:hypothetical protein